MTEVAKEIASVNLEDEMRQSYLDYAMSVIVGRALPDVRDGLKPVHRRILYSMHEANNVWNRPYVKCARIVGDVLGKYHPHGDTATYDALVRMAQDFSMRYPLVDGQGNFGSVDGDPPAAYRYTECRMAQLSGELLADIDRHTVEFVPNYDEREREPSALPTRVPNLLINGSAGIAVGMATNIPPHNLVEVIGACIALIDNPEIDVAGLMTHLRGPDFPTAGVINGIRGIVEAYSTGRGRIYVRAKSMVESDDSGRDRIVVTELPYQVNKARLLEKIAELVKEKKLEGIAELRDESDKDGMRMVVELKRGEVAEVILNNLYQHTQMQNVFGINMVALVDGQPRLITLKQALQAFVRHRREVVTRRTIFDLRKARERAHVLEGQAVALANIDDIIALIKASPSPPEAKAAMMARAWKSDVVAALLARTGAEDSRPDGLTPEFGLNDTGYRLSDAQAQAILDLRLQRLTALEQDKIVKDYGELLESIAVLLKILRDPDRLLQVIRDELIAVRIQFSDKRRTKILQNQLDLSMEDLIPDEEVVVTLSHAGYAKSQPLDTYRAQRRGGRGKAAASFKAEDFIDKLFVASTHDTLLCFSSRGRVYWLKVYELPQGGRGARGKPVVNLLPLEEDERINVVRSIREFTDDCFVFMATSGGVVKKTPLVEFSRPRASGIIAIDLRENDALIGAAITDGSEDVILTSNAGKAVRFKESEVRFMGRTAAGVRGIRLGSNQRVISLLTVHAQDAAETVLIATEHGFGKRTPVADFPTKGRGGQGVIAIQTNARNGSVIGAELVGDDDEIMLITDSGVLVRTGVAGISIVGRNTQGVTLIRLSEGERLVELERIEGLDGDEAGEPLTVNGD
ncbi:MAG: DNA gyrase subunit A [Pseudomonadota bacterium]|nr:DNA gyrase subunit A [Pseudomonadota bacterium]